jgi:CBS domain-containing protein
MSVADPPLLVPGLRDVFVAAIADDPALPPARAAGRRGDPTPFDPRDQPGDSTMTPAIADLRVAALMTLDPVTVPMDATVEDAEELLREFHITGLPVVDDNEHLVGVISQTDLLYLAQPSVQALIRHRDQGIRIGEVMSVPPITVDSTTWLADAARLMHDHHLHRVVVVDGANRPVGVVSSMDFVALAAGG